MPRNEHTTIDIGDLVLTRAPDGEPVTMSAFTGVQILVLLRHRH